MNVKQIIVLRADIRNTKGEKVRTGKLIAQGSHASISWLSNRLRAIGIDKFQDINTYRPTVNLSNAEAEWLTGSFTKICLVVDSEAELKAIHEAALAAGLESHLITDAGLTEFNGVPTVTCLAIGPDYAEKIDVVTKHLRLY